MNFVQFWLVFAYLVAIATLFASLKIQIAYLNSSTPKPYHIRRNWHYIGHRTEICAFLAFCVNFVAMATSFAPLKFLLAYLNSQTPKTLPYTQTLSP